MIIWQKAKRNFFINKSALCENWKPKSSMPLPPCPDSFVEDVKSVHLQCCIWLNALKVTLSSLKVEFNEWKVRGD